MNENLQNIPKDIYEFIVAEELDYSKGIDILGWNWSMQEHIKTSFYYKHGRLLNGNDDNTPVKNIIKPILNMQYWVEDIDIKDIVIYIENPELHHLSFLVKKYHDDVFLQENNLDSLLDEINQSRIDYAGGLVMDIGKARPQRMELETIVFCNQSNMLTSPIGFKFYLSPSDLQDMADRGWGDKKKGATHTIEETIILSRTQSGSEGGKIKEPAKGKYIQVYMVIGNMPQSYLDDSDSDKYAYQMQAVCFYQDKDGQKKGITLLALKCKNPFKLIKRDEVFGRALGYGGIEELFEAFVWTTYNEIQKKEMMDAAAKILHITDDEDFVKRNHSLKNVSNNEVLLLAEGKTVKQMDTLPRSFILLEKTINEWQAYAQEVAGAPNPLMGKEAPSGTPFALQNLVVQTGKSSHDFRRGQYAKFIEEIYRDWIIPYICKEITKGQKFLSTLSLDEMEKVSEKMVKVETNKKIKGMILSGKIIDTEEIEAFKQTTKEQFMKNNEKFIEIIKDELKDAQLNIKINVASKQKNLAEMTDKLSNIFRQVFSTYNPQTGQFAIFQNAGMTKLFNQILEQSGFSEINFSDMGQSKQQVQQPQANQQIKQPIPMPQPAVVG